MAEKKESRSKRWARASSVARDAVSELLDIQSEFEEWRDSLPENLQQSAVGEKLETICDLDIQGAMDTLDEAENTDVPLGFGRD